MDRIQNYAAVVRDGRKWSDLQRFDGVVCDRLSRKRVVVAQTLARRRFP